MMNDLYNTYWPAGAILEIRVGVIALNATPQFTLRKSPEASLSAVYCTKLRYNHCVQLVRRHKINFMSKKIIFL